MKGNNINVKGTVVKDAEFRYTNSGRAVAKFAVAWNSSRKNGQTGEWEDEAHFFDAEAWMSERQAAVLEGQLLKGAKIAITDAHIEQDKWQTQSGENRSKVVIKVDDPISGMLVVPRDSDASYGASSYSEPEQGALYDEDVPF